jgi:hypothetical protein
VVRRLLSLEEIARDPRAESFVAKPDGTRRPQVLIVDGEPAAGLELPRHVVPAPLIARRVLATDLASIREALSEPTVAAIVDGRSRPETIETSIATLRAIPGGETLPVLVLGLTRDDRSPASRVEHLASPPSLPAIRARLLLLTGRRDLRISTVPPARTG